VARGASDRDSTSCVLMQEVCGLYDAGRAGSSQGEGHVQETISARTTVTRSWAVQLVIQVSCVRSSTLPRRRYGSKSTATSAGGVSAGTLNATTLTSDPVWRQRQLPSAISAHTCAPSAESCLL